MLLLLSATVILPTTYIDKPPAKKKQLKRELDTAQDPIVSTVEGGSYTSRHIKGLEAKHIAYYFGDIKTPHILNSCTSHLEKLPTMVTKSSGLGGAMICTLPQKSFQTTTGISSNGGQQQHVNFHAEKNNHFFTGALAYNNDGGWYQTPSRYRQLGIKNRTATMEGVFETGHQDAEQKLTISSANQYLRYTYDDLFENTTSSCNKEHERFFNLFGVAYERQKWRTFGAIHTTKMMFSGAPSAAQTITLTAGTKKIDADHKFGCFTEQINGHKVYRYDVYGGKRMGPFYPSVRLIKTERQILCPFEIVTQLAKPIQIICGSAYHLPDELERFDPNTGNFDLRPEHNYHCHLVHNWENSEWTVEQTLFINHITDMIDFVGFTKPLQNRGSLNSVGIDQSIGYNGFDRYKIGYAHTYCVIDGSKPVLHRPAWKFLMWQRFYLSEDCFVDLRTRFTGAYLSSDVVAFEKHVKMPAIFLWDVSTTHILNKRWTILCEIKNLTNRHYESPSGYVAKGIEAWVRFVYTI